MKPTTHFDTNEKIVLRLQQIGKFSGLLRFLFLCIFEIFKSILDAVTICEKSISYITVKLKKIISLQTILDPIKLKIYLHALQNSRETTQTP